MKNTYYKILNEIAAAFDMDQWDEQVNLFTDDIKDQLGLNNPFIHNTKYDWIYILENSSFPHFPQFDFYKERCYINGKKVKLNEYGKIANKWKDQETVKVIIKDLDQLNKSCKNMFSCCISLVSVPLFDTSRVKNMRSMFFGCWSLESVPEFDTRKVTTMKNMFSCCESLVSVPEFDTRKVTDMENMFKECKSLSKETKQEWSSVYNFTRNEMK